MLYADNLADISWQAAIETGDSHPLTRSILGGSILRDSILAPASKSKEHVRRPAKTIERLDGGLQIYDDFFERESEPRGSGTSSYVPLLASDQVH